MKTLKFENPKLHVICWTVYIAYELAVIFIFGVKFSSVPDYVGFYILNIGIFYFNAHILLPNTADNGKKSFFIIPLAILGELAIYILLKFLLLSLLKYLDIPVSRPFVDISSFLSESFYRAFYFIGLSTGYWFALSTFQNRKKIADLEHIQLRKEIENQALEKTLLATENAYLRSQINPHFLLNTLNFLYNSVSKFSDQVADSVMTLSDIMRYALTNADEDGKMALESEIEHVSGFVKLNRARFGQRLCLDFTIDGEPEGLRIIPLILITLAENVFKYGDLFNESSPAKIKIIIEGSTLMFITQNQKRKVVTARSYGIGIENVKSRLAMYHPYDLSIEDNETEYKSVLKIEL